jgi:hypothetical protein
MRTIHDDNRHSVSALISQLRGTIGGPNSPRASVASRVSAGSRGSLNPPTPRASVVAWSGGAAGLRKSVAAAPAAPQTVGAGGQNGRGRGSGAAAAVPEPAQVEDREGGSEEPAKKAAAGADPAEQAGAEPEQVEADADPAQPAAVAEDEEMQLARLEAELRSAREKYESAMKRASMRGTAPAPSPEARSVPEASQVGIQTLQAELRTVGDKLHMRNRRCTELESENATLRAQLDAANEEMCDLKAKLSRFETKGRMSIFQR